MTSLDLEKLITDATKSLDNYYDGIDRVLASQKKIAVDFKNLQQKITNNIALEHCEALRSALQTLRDTIEAVNAAHDTAVTARLQGTVLDKFHETRSLTVLPMVKLLSVVKKDRAKWMDRKKSKKYSNREDSERKLKYEEDARTKYEIEAVELYNSISKFEETRTQEVHTTLKEFCNSQLYYHCHAVESWGKALQHVANIDMQSWYSHVDKNVQKMLDMENLTSYLS